MNDHLLALLVYDQPHPLESLKVVLEDLNDLSVETCSVRTCEEARRLVPQAQPHLIFTDISLPDGSWRDVVGMAEEANSPVDVIVVGAHQDIRLYVSVLEGGGFDFVLPPLSAKRCDSSLSRLNMMCVVAGKRMPPSLDTSS